MNNDQPWNCRASKVQVYKLTVTQSDETPNLDARGCKLTSAERNIGTFSSNEKRHEDRGGLSENGEMDPLHCVGLGLFVRPALRSLAPPITGSQA
jgi:hypothetical protein